MNIAMEDDVETKDVERLAKLLEIADEFAERGAENIVLVDDFPHRTGLDMPLNDPPGQEMLTVAELSIEDSGWGPSLWSLALAVIKNRSALRTLSAQLETERRRSEGLREGISELLRNVTAEHASFETGCCMCGIDMNAGIYAHEGHAATDSGVYYMEQAISLARATLEDTK